MKINEKDLMSGLFLMLIAAVGLYLNMDHTMGSARRMGPGYMPWMVFWLQIGLGAGAVLVGLFGNSEKLARWTGQESLSFILGIAAGVGTWYALRYTPGFFGQTYNAVGTGLLVGFLVLSWAPGWRFVGLINASLCLFGLLLEQMGFFAALIGIIVLSCLAEEQHLKKPLGILGTTVFLLIMCWVVFINRLDIRVNLWPQL
ncbi:MAG: hypothetical protein H7345_18045 [Rubritepida sp.]|nr:hypothetical protein [Rubritepida sp.]